MSRVHVSMHVPDLKTDVQVAVQVNRFLPNKKEGVSVSSLGREMREVRDALEGRTYAPTVSFWGDQEIKTRFNDFDDVATRKELQAIVDFVPRKWEPDPVTGKLTVQPAEETEIMKGARRQAAALLHALDKLAV